MDARCFSGARLREARIAAGLRPEQLAFHVGRSVYSIHEYERGRVCPPAEVIERLANALAIHVDFLLTEAQMSGTVESSQLDRHVRQVVDNFPRLDADQRSRIATLLRTAPGGGAV